MYQHVVRATRYEAAIPARYRLAGESGWKQGLTRNISDTGVLFETTEPLHVESLVELSFRLGEELGHLPCGRLTWIGKVARRPAPTEAVPYAAAARLLELHSES